MTAHELSQLCKELFVVRKKLKYTVYSARLNSVCNLIRKVYEEIKPVSDKKEEIGAIIVGDFEVIEEEYKKLVANCPLEVGTGPSTTKIG